MIFESSNWIKPDPAEMISWFNQSNSTKKRGVLSFLGFRKHLSPLDTYKYLVARFGKPYGFQTFLKKDSDSDNLIHWDYLVKAGPHMLVIQGGNRDVHVHVDGLKMSPRDWVQFTKALKRDFGRVGSEMAEVGKTLERWSVVSNRFAMIADACAGLHDILTDDTSAPDFTPHRRTSREEAEGYYQQIKEMGKRADRLFSASLSLDLMTPVLAEAFINLTIFLTRKDELKKNNRQYEQFIRQPIDVRVFDLHLKCDHFIGSVDPGHDEYKSFKRVMDRRNHNLHGNIDPLKDSIDTVYFDKYTPLYGKGADPISELFRKNEAIFDVTGVLTRYHDVHAFFHYILSLIDEKPRGEIQLLMSDNTFGYDMSRQRPGRLFPEHEVMMVMPMEYDDELDVDWE